MSNLFNYIALGVTSLLAIWNLRLQMRMKHLESRNITLKELVEKEYNSYHLIWKELANVHHQTQFLRWPRANHQDMASITATVTVSALDTYREQIDMLNKVVIAHTPFIDLEISELLKSIVNTSRMEYFQTLSNIDTIGVRELENSRKNLDSIMSGMGKAEDLLRRKMNGLK